MDWQPWLEFGDPFVGRRGGGVERDLLWEHRASSFPAMALNPSAAPFVPSAYRAVEDYSREWRRLVAASAAFRTYWLTSRAVAGDVRGGDGSDGDSAARDCEIDLPDDVDDLFYSFQKENGAGNGVHSGGGMSAAAAAAAAAAARGEEKPRRLRNVVKGPRCIGKAANFVGSGGMWPPASHRRAHLQLD